MNRTTPATSITAKTVVFAVPSLFRVSWAGTLLMVFFCTRLYGYTNDGVAPVGSIPWELNQVAAKQRQEQSRMRVPVPAAVFGPDAPQSSGLFPALPRNNETAPGAATYAPVDMWAKVFIATALIIIVGLVVLKRIAPQVYNEIERRLNPLAAVPASGGTYQENIRAEEAAFKNFLSVFRVGSKISSRPEPVTDRENPADNFYPEAVRLLGAQKKLLQQIRDAADDHAKQKLLAELHVSLVGLKNEALFPEALPVRQVASALDVFVNHLIGKLASVNASTLQTIATGLDLLGEICVPGLKLDSLTNQPLKFLVVDDDLISRQAMSLALKKAFADPDVALNGETALVMAAKQAYDVIFLDVQMPGMDGFELCTKIRETTANHATPVIFVAAQSDYEARRKSALCGGNDLMGKPFLILEITLKALTLAWHGRLEKQKLPPEPQMNGTPAGAPLPPATISDHQPADEVISRAAAHLGTVGDFCRMISETSDEVTRQNLLADVLLHVTSMVSRDHSTIRHPASQVSIALEGLLKKMLQRAGNSTPSAVASVTAAVNLLQDLCGQKPVAPVTANSPWNILVVDDDLVTRRVIVGALQTYFTRPESAENGEEALIKAAEKHYDIIFMDVVMPGLDGLETCAKIRGTDMNRQTPVVFVTSCDDFHARAQLSRNSGHEMMAKPFLIPEIMVKALTLAIRHRLPDPELAPPAPVDPKQLP